MTGTCGEDVDPTSISHRVGESRPLPQEPTDGEQALTKTSCKHKACRDTPHIEITIVTMEGTPSLLEHLTVGPLLAVDHHFPSKHVLEAVSYTHLTLPTILRV